MRRSWLAALVVAVLALVAGASPAVAVWPTTCIEANDAFEFAAGRHENVGIYQRVYGNAAAAEAACRRDHRDDISSAFWWAVQGVDRAPGPVATPEPTPAPPPPASAPIVAESSHPEFERIRDIAVARDADSATAATVADQVSRAGDTRAFIRGTANGWQFGTYDCWIRSWSFASNRGPACPWVGVGRRADRGVGPAADP